MKDHIDQLAIFGQEPAFSHKLHIGAPNLGDEALFLDLVEDALRRRWLTNGGPYLEELETRIASRLGVRHCVAMVNGTVALEILLRALGLPAGAEVIVPAFTFVATAHALQWMGLTPVFAEIDPATHNLDPAQVEALITPRTAAILAVHVWGRPAPVEALEAIAAAHRLPLLFDAAHAFGCSHGGRMVGNFGRAEVFSFHATKFFNTLEGGAVTTNDDALAAELRLMRNFGFEDYDSVVQVGTNGKLNEISAAMGLAQLGGLEQVIARNRANWERYAAQLAGLPGVSLAGYDPAERCNYQYVVLEIDGEQAGLSRDRLMNLLWAENVLARRYFYPGIHRMEPYRSQERYAGLALPETERLAGRTLLLPTGTAVGTGEIDTIAYLIRLALERAGQINQVSVPSI